MVVSLSGLELVEGSLDVDTVLVRYVLNDLIPTLSLRLGQNVPTLGLADVEVIRGQSCGTTVFRLKVSSLMGFELDCLTLIRTFFNR